MYQYRIFSTLVFFLLFFFPQFGTAQFDSLKNLGHASMKIKTAGGTIIYIDPYAGTDYTDSADILLVTHSHNDHNQQSLVKMKSGGTVITYTTAIVAGVYQSFSVGTIKIDAVAAYNANHPKSSCVGYVLEFNGIKLYHAGDTGNIPEMANLAPRNLSYALLPMEGVFTMTPEEAMLSAAAIKAQQYIPIHTMTSQNDTVSDAIVARFAVPNKILLKNNRSIALLRSPAILRSVDAALPSEMILEQNFPNPFNPETQFRFVLSKEEEVTLKIYDPLGRSVGMAAEGRFPAGAHSVRWSAGSVPAGTYYYQLKSRTHSLTKSFQIIK
jgi:L-ascorbate metabolism protein UlaG (beta-lactamase superfamily)